MGGFQREGEGSWTSPQRSISWHMHPTVIAAGSNSFCKDGRKISVGDCALFKPPRDSPPFIGLIRCLTIRKDNNLQLGVNWLYRPAEIKLGKGALLDGAPNEIFYSFHKDEIPAASLFHPCKVAFLPRGAELPTGTSSFVCRRVYDIENKCIWWLTDQDYVNERQEEVDQLLYKTRIEMHETPHPGGRSPKLVIGPTSVSPLKPGSDNVQNSGTSFPSQGKGKKRERGDHAADPVKRERFSRTDEGDSAQYKAESSLKSDIARITEKGGVVDLEGVEKLVQLIQPDRMDRKMDWVSRSMLVGVIAATEKVECLNRFVQLRGLPVLDEWLQDIHKGKGGGNSSKDGDKSVEDFLLVLLRALDKLPVNLHALQTCNIGRSVNHLRSHKNAEIQRKARSLVDTWKKRVEAEMISNDAKSGSTQATSVWSSKSRLPEVSQGGKTTSGSDVVIKSSITQHSASKTTSVKSSHGESIAKSASSSPGPVKPASPCASGKESQPGISVGGTLDAPLIREDRSSSSNRSHSHSQSISGKEEAKSCTAASVGASKISSSSSRNRKGSGFPSVTAGQKENSSGRSSLAHRNTASDKLSQSAVTSERVPEGPVVEACSHKLIVKIPNRVRSPTPGVSGVSLEDPSIMNSRTSSPGLSDKLEQYDNNPNEKSDAFRSDTNVSSCRISDRKDALTGSRDGAGSPAALPDEEKNMSSEDSRRMIEVRKRNPLKSGRLHETSFSPMNALIESCVKYSEAHSSLSLEDDVGMNLLASVATGEMSRSELVSPTGSTERSTPAVQEPSFGDEGKSKSSPEDHIPGSRTQSVNDAESDDRKQAVLDGSSRSEDGLDMPRQASLTCSADRTSVPTHTSADIPAAEANKPFESVSTDLRSTCDPMREVNEKSKQKTDADDGIRDGEANKKLQEEKAPSSNVSADNILNCKSDGTNVAVTADQAGMDPLDTDKMKLMVEVASSNPSCDEDCKGDVKQGFEMGTNSQHKFTAPIVNFEYAERANNGKPQETAPGQSPVSEASHEVKISERDELDTKRHISEAEREKLDRTLDRNTAVEGHSLDDSCLHSNELRIQNLEANVEKKEITDNISLPEGGLPAPVAHEAQRKCELRGSKSAGIGADEAESASTVAEASTCAITASGPDAKMKFDLNEGFIFDDGKYGEPVGLIVSGSTNGLVPFSVDSVPSSHPSSVTVAAAAKGPFVPPEDLLRSKGELGWKGSAATSAFRPAEPRKVLEMPLPSTNFLYDASTSKNGRTLLDIDLNVPDERVIEEMASRDSALTLGMKTDFVNKRAALLNESSGSVPVLGCGGLDFDLNRVDEANETGQCSTSSNLNGKDSMVHVKPLSGLPSTDVQRDFDLNDGPGVDEAGAEHLTISQQVKVRIPPQLPSAGARMNNPGLGSFSSWFPPGNTYSTVAIPSIRPDRADQPFPVIPPGAPQRTFGSAGITPFTPDVYRGSILSSSPAVSFPSSPFQFPVFPFGPTFPLPSASFPVGATSYADSSSGARLFAPPVNSQLFGSVGAISSQFQRPYVVSLPDSSSNGGLENNRKWGRQGLDLNAGPGAIESEVKEDMLPLSSSQNPVASSQPLTEEQARMYSVSGSILKRKEAEGGWDNESFRYKQSSWQ
ncbi:hypothetical protein Salat_0051500 [Sesamum alatum]|uniref:Uncharacterized protein n=1 Tax=Sesamum alatum TaxID=300844 RepID=A0AAE1YWS8_9LAMI|nr:hypothetical protein Salat_0051500 [Sesamum alatum]